jgi:heme exporter protein CcmD
VNAFLAMGGYAAFVWPAYGLAAAVFAWNIWSALRLYTVARARALRRAAGSGDTR